MGKVEVSNAEPRTVHDAMRELNRMVDALEQGDSEISQHMRGRRLRGPLTNGPTGNVAPRRGAERQPPSQRSRGQTAVSV